MKRDRFLRLAVYRTNEVLKKIRILGHCANRSAYDYSEEDINKIFSEMEHEMKEVRSRFRYPKHGKKFTLEV